MEPFENATLLLITADVTRAEYLSDQLQFDDFEVVVADDVGMGLRSLDRCYPDLVVVDARLPGGSGLSIVAAIREADAAVSRVDPATPVLVMAPDDDPLERVRALERGADDAVAGPVHYPELVARARSLVRRAQRRTRRGLVRVGPLEVDPVSRHVRLGERELELSQKEFALLQLLASEPTRVFSKDELLRAVWGFRGGSRTRTLDSHACRLRQKLRVDGGRFVVNVWGVGYRLVDGAVEVVPELPAAASHGLKVAA